MEILAARFIALFGLLILVLSVYGLMYPRSLLTIVGKAIDSGAGWVLAVGVRLVLGLALLLSAPVSVWPLLFKVVGVLTIIAAFVILFIGPKKVLSLIAWVERRSDAALRVWLVLGVAFSLFLVYCVHPAIL